MLMGLDPSPAYISKFEHWPTYHSLQHNDTPMPHPILDPYHGPNVELKAASALCRHGCPRLVLV